MDTKKQSFPSLYNLLECNFKINFLEDKYKGGKPSELDGGPTGQIGWIFHPTEDFWDFNIDFGFNKTEKVTELYRKGELFSKQIRNLYASFLNELNYLLSHEKDHLLRSVIIDSLHDIKIFLAKYGDDYIYYEQGYFSHEILLHDDMRIEYIPIEKHLVPDFTNYVMSFYFAEQKKHLKLAEVELKNAVNQIAEGSVPDVNRSVSRLSWKASDTDLLELIVALIETNSISNSRGNLSRKELVSTFEELFSFELKDFESKLTRATERKKETSPYLGKLKQAFDDYCLRKIERKE